MNGETVEERVTVYSAYSVLFHPLRERIPLLAACPNIFSSLGGVPEHIFLSWRRAPTYFPLLAACPNIFSSLGGVP
jgi:hypothetical protein